MGCQEIRILQFSLEQDWWNKFYQMSKICNSSTSCFFLYLLKGFIFSTSCFFLYLLKLFLFIISSTSCFFLYRLQFVPIFRSDEYVHHDHHKNGEDHRRHCQQIFQRQRKIQKFSRPKKKDTKIFTTKEKRYTNFDDQRRKIQKFSRPKKKDTKIFTTKEERYKNFHDQRRKIQKFH